MNLPAMQDTWARFLGWKDPQEKEMATHSSILTWRINPMDKGAWWATVCGVTRVRHNLASNLTKQQLSVNFSFAASC